MEKLRKAIEETKGLDVTKAGQYTLGQWMRVWYEKLRHHQGAAQLPRNVQGNHQKPHRPGYRPDSPHQVDHPRLAEVLPGLAYRRAGGAKGVGKKAQGPWPQDCAEYPSNHFLGTAAGHSPKAHRPHPAEGCALPRVERNEMKTLTADQLGAFLREAKRTGVFEMYYLELATGLRRGELLG